ncbi:CusA/CzcA family heavy metal efflux RND transporter [Pedobacter frigiditerrae]|uniref:CusA/CzcA family heavy metal efflux RND transporter n=1 Tax=Pedobacter frigiditerrae TaxID=2530452 RepID=A0A4R0MP30_9SPHI|nr:CusA/CzcA family heavy metal efflux RND transporter [Pedobacter frigiditerrae]TCC87992.1 CusA/CzcA family heavy metal efflux RND transporter [Pedobacter frigiditerrae]
MLDNIIKFSIQNKLAIGLMTLLLIIWGVWSASKLPIDALPDITDNQVQIITQSPTLAAQEVEQYVTYPIEKVLANLPDIAEMRSFSRFGLSVITVVFKDEVDVYFARQLISEKLKQAEKEIPESMGRPELAPVTTGLGEIYQYVIHPKDSSKNKYSAMDLRTMQDWIVARQLNGIAGVAEVTGFGGVTKQYEVAVNPDRLKSMDVSIPEIFSALEKNNENTGGAYIDKKPNAYFIRGIGVVKSFDDIENIVVKNPKNGTPILIRDVAKVQFGTPARYGAMTYNGEKEVVGGLVLMLKGANSSEVVSLVKERMETVQSSLPDDIIIEPFLDRTNLVDRAIGTVQKNLIEGALIVIFVLIVFLGNFRAGLIVASAIPLALLFAMGLMNLFGVSANLMSLGAIDFGLIVDGAVIIVEATLHHLGLRKSMNTLTQKEMDEEVFLSASKIRSSAAFGEIIILIVYIPILALVGIEGKMFRPMAQTVGFSIFGALILSLTYIPMMSALFLSKKAVLKKNFSDKMMNFFQGIYQPLLAKVIKIKYIVTGVTVGILLITVIVFSKMGGEFIPTLEEGDYAIEFVLPQGASLSQTVETVMQAERIIKQFPEVKMVVGKTGAADVATDPMPMQASDLIVVLKDKSEWTTSTDFYELADLMKEKLENIPGIIAEPSQPIQMRFNELMTGIRQDVAVKIFGENLDTLANYANKVSKAISKIEGITQPQIERISGLPQISIDYDRSRMAAYGLNVEDINHIITAAFAGEVAGQVYENERKFDLVVRLDSAYRTSLDDVNNLFVPTNSGNQIPLSQIANVSYKLGPAQISREDGKRRVYVSFNVNGRDVQSVVEDIQTKLAKDVKLPAGYYFTYGGTFENLQQASKRLMIAVPLSLLLIFVLLYFTFHSFKQAGLIFTAIPMSAIGGVFALLLRGMPFSISAGIGFIALFGVAVLNGIVLIGTFNQLEKEGWTDVVKRVIEGTKIRLRPVLMTAIVASFGFLPMALSSSAGAEVQKPLATVVIGGLFTATFLTLFVLPLLYIIFNSKPSSKKLQMKTVSLIIMMLLFGFGQSANAQVINDKTVIGVDEAIAIALKNNNELKAKSLEVSAAQSLKGTASELPKLDLNAQLGQYNSVKFDNAFQVEQTIPFPTLFGAKKSLINAQTQSKQIQQLVTANDLKNRVRNYYYQVVYLTYNKVKLQYLDTLYIDFVKAAALRFKTGETKKLELSTAETKQGEIKLLLQQNESYLINAYQNLKGLMNVKEDFGIENPKLYEPLKVSTLLDSATISNHPTIKLWYQEALVVEQQIKLEKASALPDFKIGYNNQSLIGFQTVNGQEQYFNGNKRFSSVNVGLAIPIGFGANKARVQSLNYQKQAAQANAQYQQQQLTAQFNDAVQQYQQHLQEHNYYVQKALPNAKEIVQVAKLGYRTGDINYVEYLYALQTATDLELKYLEVIQQVNQSVVLVNYLINQ